MRQKRITECDRFRDYKVRQSSMTNSDRFWITKCHHDLKKWITKCDGITKRDALQSDTVQHEHILLFQFLFELDVVLLNLPLQSHELCL